VAYKPFLCVSIDELIKREDLGQALSLYASGELLSIPVPEAAMMVTLASRLK